MRASAAAGGHRRSAARGVTAADGDGDLRDSVVSAASALARAMLRPDRDPMVDAAAENGLTYRTHNPPSGPALLVRFGGTSRQGVLALTRGPGKHRFDEQEAQMAAGFARHAGLAIKIATAREVAQQATQRVLRSEDRGRIARDLHDHVIGGLFATGLGIQALAGRTADDADAARLGGFVDDLDQAIHTIRRSIFELRAGADAPRFRAAVLAAAHEAASALGFDPAVRLEGPLDWAVEPPRAEQAIAVLREALTNAARHAQASNVDVAVSVTGDELRVAVADDGVGLGQPSRHSGLDNLRTRAELLGGRLVVFAGSAGGTRLEWAVPLNG